MWWDTVKVAEEQPTHPRPATLQDTFTPFPHQEEAIQKLLANDGKLVLAHQTGTGKTATSIYGFELLKTIGKGKRALVVVPSGLRENYVSGGVRKYTKDSSTQIVGTGSEVTGNPGYVRPEQIAPDKDYTVISYDMFRRDPVGAVQRSGADTLIMDEFHKVRNEDASVFKAAMEARGLVRNFIGISGSPINNSPTELATLLTLSEGKRMLTPADFKRRYMATVGYTSGIGKTRKPVQTLTNVPSLLYNTNPRISYAETTALGADMPKKVVTNVTVPMSDEQWKLYQYSLGKLGPLQKYIVENDPNVSLREANTLFTQLVKARQISNNVGAARANMTPEQAALATPKTRQVLEDTAKKLKESPDEQVVLYSNLINGGVDVLSAGLKSMGIDHALFVGKGTEVGNDTVTSQERQEGVKEFQEGKKRVIVLSGAGAEGLDLKDATAFYALDGHFNPQRVLQAEARAVRLNGQSARPPEKRSVDVRRYMSVPPTSAQPGMLAKALGAKKAPLTVDQWTYDVAGGKFKQQQQFFKEFKLHKYIRKVTDARGNVRYIYSETNPRQPRATSNRGLLGRLSEYFYTADQRAGATGSPTSSQPQPAQPPTIQPIQRV